MSNVDSPRADELIGTYSLRDLLTIIFKRRVLVLAICISTVVAVMILGLRAPKTYVVSATLLVNESRAQMPLAPADSQQLIVSRVSEQDLNTEIEILKGRQLMEDVLRTLNTEEPTETNKNVVKEIVAIFRRSSDDGELSYFDRQVVYLQHAIEVSAIRKSSVIKVSLRSSDPEWATQVVGALTDRYLEQRTERYNSSETVAFFDGQMKSAEARLATAEEALEQSFEGTSITMVSGPGGLDSLAAQKNIVMARLAQLESDLGAAKVEVETQRGQVASLRKMLAREPERLASSSRFNQAAANEEIEKALTILRLERDKLLLDFRPDSRYVRDIDTQIKMAEDRLAERSDGLKVSGTEANPLFGQLRSELLLAESGFEGSLAKVSSLQEQLVSHRSNLNELNSKAFEVEHLLREARAAEDDYLLYRKKHEEARISAAMDQEKFINVTIAQPARMPLVAESRGLKMKLVLSLLLGLAGGIGVAFGLENYIDRSFTTGEDVERRLGLNHIASIPESDMVG